LANGGLTHRVNLAKEAAQHDVFGRNGGVGLQLEDPMAVLTLAAQQRIPRPQHSRIQRRATGRVAGHGHRRGDTRQTIQDTVIPSGR
jgi:hypothetical protein